MSKPPTDEAWLSASDAVDAARRGVLDHGLDRDPSVGRAIHRGHPGKPRLVERLDRPESSYYLVPWVTTEGVVFVVQVEASSGDTLTITTYPKPTPSPLLPPQEARKRAASAHPERSFGRPRLVWQPCRESTTPMQPLYRIPFDGGAVYVDMAGSVFEELTPLGRGGGESGEAEGRRSRGAGRR